MKKESLDFYKEAAKAKKGFVSYSSFSTWAKCPHKFKLTKIDKIHEDRPSIHLSFGNAIHDTIQGYLKIMFGHSAKLADELDLISVFKERFMQRFQEDREKFKMDFSSREEFEEFFWDGVNILNFFKSKRRKWFSKRGMKLLGVEVPIFMECEANKNVMFNGFIDILIKEGKKLKIIDIKTSTRGWRDWHKKDHGDQLRLYKIFTLLEHKRLDIDEVEVEYFIVKRKINEDAEWVQHRVQIFRPSAGKVSINKTQKKFDRFVREAYTSDGKINKDGDYPAIHGPEESNCKFCEFKDRHDLCPPNKRKLLRLG